VRVTITEARRSLCAARLSVQMKAYAKPLPSVADPQPRHRPRVPVVMLCNKNASYSAPKDRFALEVESAMERSIMRCLGRLKD
jgi:hypothetical protein